MEGQQLLETETQALTSRLEEEEWGGIPEALPFPVTTVEKAKDEDGSYLLLAYSVHSLLQARAQFSPGSLYQLLPVRPQRGKSTATRLFFFFFNNTGEKLWNRMRCQKTLQPPIHPRRENLCWASGYFFPNRISRTFSKSTRFWQHNNW